VPTVSVVSPGYYRLRADRAGIAGNYGFDFFVNDGRGESNSTTTRHYIIYVKNPPPRLTASPVNYTVSSTNPFLLTMTAVDDVYTYPLHYELADTLLTDYGLLIYQGHPQPTFLLDSNNVFYTFRLQGVFAPGNPTDVENRFPPPPNSRVWQVDTAKKIQFHVNVSDDYDAVSGKDLVINLKNNKPTVNVPILCDKFIRRGYSFPSGYEYSTCGTTAHDPDGNAILYHDYPTGLPSGLDYNRYTGLVSGIAGWDCANNSAQSCPHPAVKANVTDEYGAVSHLANFKIQVNSYCGDSIKQNNVDRVIGPNSAGGRGGPAGDGIEQCDAGGGFNSNSGVSSLARDSRSDYQYSCTTYNSSTICPLDTSANPSLCSGTCTYTGGWCGDGIPQYTTTGDPLTGGVRNRPGFAPEECDTGSYSDSCWSSTLAPAPRNDTCVLTWCGDGRKQSPNGRDHLLEICDRGSSNGLNTSSCGPNCQPARCGDHSTQSYTVTDTSGTVVTVTQEYEQCDEGTGNDNYNSVCTMKCQIPRCGDGFRQPLHQLGFNHADEECDLGDGVNGAPGSDCKTDCTINCHPCVFNDNISVFGTGVFTGTLTADFGCCFQAP
jgi:hypothetical protein